MNKKKKSKTNNRCSKNLDSSGSGNSRVLCTLEHTTGTEWFTKDGIFSFFFFLSDFYLLKNNFVALILQRTYKYVLHG